MGDRVTKLPVGQNVGERMKARYVHDLDGLDDACKQMIAEMETLREQIAEARSVKGGQAGITTENRISAAYRSLMKKIGVIQALEQAGVWNPQGR